ncbi:MAG: O-antigen ligase family protein [Pseudomonadota bacterium]
MLNNIKALVVVLFFATAIFTLARSACLHFMSEEDFRRRRAVWFVTTVAVFISPSVWLFILITIPIAIWAAKKDSSPLAASMIIGGATPSFYIAVPHLFAVNSGTALTLFIAIPVLLGQTLKKSNSNDGATRQQGNWVASTLLFTFLALQVIPYWRTESWSSLLRMAFVQIFLAMPGFWLITRTLKSYRAINEVMAVFVLTCALIAPMAVFESMRGWLLYMGVTQHWNASPNAFAYLMRSGQVRALATADHSLALGFIMALGFGFCLHLQRSLNSRKTFAVVGLLMWAGMYAAFSRGPWIAAVMIMFVYLWLMPKGTGRVVKAAIVTGLIGAVIAVTPFGERIINVLPFVGKLETGNIDYRQALLDRALQLIPLKPWFGDIFVLRQMEDLRQGQGIIDLVNGFLLIALFYGLVPLLILLWFILIVIFKVQRASLNSRFFDLNVSSLGSILIACIAGTIFYIWIARFAGELVFLSGLGLAYAKLVSADNHAAVRRLS